MSSEILYNGVNIPPETENFMSRTRFDKLMENAMNKPLIAVIAKAGFGKTQAVASYLKQTLQHKRVSWFLLSELDNVLTRYSERFLYASGKKSKETQDVLTELKVPFNEDAFKRYRDIIVDITGEDIIVQVLDDYQYINNPIMFEFIENHVSFNIPNHIIIILSRNKPAFNIDSLYEKGLVSWIVEKDLLFTKDEMSQYFESLGLFLDAESLDYFYSYTQGWVLPINRLAEILETKHHSKEEGIAALKLEINEFIEMEIYPTFSKKCRDFLIKIADYENLPAELLAELANEDLELINELDKSSFFIQYNQELKTYEFNKLFREFLLEKQIELLYEDVKTSYLCAANWYKCNDFEIDALKYYYKCGEYNIIFDIIIANREFSTLEATAFFIEIIENSPKEFIQKKPIIRVIHAKYLIGSMKFSESLKKLNQIRNDLEIEPISEESKYVLGEAYIMLAWISMLTRTYDFVELFRLAVEFLPNGSSLVDNRVQIIPGNNIRIKDGSKSNAIETFEKEYFEAMPNAVKVMNGCGYGLDYLVSAESAYILKDHKKAELASLEAIKRAKMQNQVCIENMAKFTLIRISLAKGNYKSCRNLLKEIESNLITEKFSQIQYDLIEGWFYNVIEETEKVASWISVEYSENANLLPVLVNERNIVRARSLLTEGKYYELIAFLDQLNISYEDRELVVVNIHLPIIKALALYYVGEKENAFVAFEEAYISSNPSAIIMPFIEYGTKMRTLINFLRQYENCTIPLEWLDSIYSKCSTYAKQIGKVINDYKKANSVKLKKTTELTKRELEIMTYLCHGLTREQIAASCNLSINTVKSVLQNIYSKLGATNKSDAIRIATIMNLLE